MQNAKGYFRQFCETLNNYSAIFELLPSDNMYTSYSLWGNKVACKGIAHLLNKFYPAILIRYAGLGGLRSNGRRIRKGYGGDRR